MTGDELRKIRQSVLQMTQRDLAGELRVPVNTLARWERGELAIQHVRILELALHDIAAQMTGAR